MFTSCLRLHLVNDVASDAVFSRACASETSKSGTKVIGVPQAPCVHHKIVGKFMKFAIAVGANSPPTVSFRSFAATFEVVRHRFQSPSFSTSVKRRPPRPRGRARRCWFHRREGTARLRMRGGRGTALLCARRASPRGERRSPIGRFES